MRCNTNGPTLLAPSQCPREAAPRVHLPPCACTKKGRAGKGASFRPSTASVSVTGTWSQHWLLLTPIPSQIRARASGGIRLITHQTLPDNAVELVRIHPVFLAEVKVFRACFPPRGVVRRLVNCAQVNFVCSLAHLHRSVTHTYRSS